MKYLVFDLAAHAQERAEQALIDGMALSMFPEGTAYYAQVIKHPFQVKFAIPVLDWCAVLFTPGENAAAVELAPEWFVRGIIKGTFVVTQPISPFALDPSVSRIAFSKFPVVLEDQKIFQLPVVVRHFRDGVHVWEELPDREVVLTAANDDGEFDAFYGYIAQGANMFTLIGQNIAYRDSEAGGRRFE